MCFEHCENCQPGQRRSSIGGVGHASWIPPSRRGHNKTGRRYGVYGIPLNKTISMRKSDLRWFETILDQPGFGQNHIWIDVLFILKGRIIVPFQAAVGRTTPTVMGRDGGCRTTKASDFDEPFLGRLLSRLHGCDRQGGVKDEPVRIYDIRYLTVGHNSYHKFRECRWCRCLFEE